MERLRAIIMETYDIEIEGCEVESREYELDGDVYGIDIKIITYQISGGNYSPRAVYPEEYTGVFGTDYEILGVYDSNGSCIPKASLPEDILQQIHEEFDYEEGGIPTTLYDIVEKIDFNPTR